MSELSREELAMPRTAAQYLLWVDSRIEELAATPQGKRAVRFRTGLAKPLVEEALPLGIFAQHHFGGSDSVDIRLVLGNQSYDAIVEDNRDAKSPFSFVEITQAHAGEDEYLRMLALDREGRVSALGPVHKVGTKATGIYVDVENVGVTHSDILEAELARVESAITRKLGKAYPSNTALLVVFDDHISIRDENDKDALRARITPLLPDVDNFCWLAIVGWTRRTFEEFDLVRVAS